MKSIVIVQARTNSQRLPAKVLLPVGGLPVAVLAAKRASNTGKKVIVATSRESEDDGLAEILDFHRIEVFRGDLDDVLSRFVSALEGIEDHVSVFRLTADNVFPDGRLLDELEKEFTARNMDYLSCSGKESGLPYGMSAEVMKVQGIRNAAINAREKSDREHVTPYLIRRYGQQQFTKYRDLNKSMHRCTIDNLDDYNRVARAFSGVSHPVSERWENLLERLEQFPPKKTVTKSASRLVMGTAQWGGHYGVANQSGVPDAKECRNMVRTALVNGCCTLDTARAYGISERVIGDALRHVDGRTSIITKLAPMDECPLEVSRSIACAYVDASIFQSCRELKVSSIDVLMLHRAEMLSGWNGEVWKRLLEHKKERTIGQLGVSVQTPQELLQSLKVSDLEYIQMPWNILDGRWDLIIPEIIKAKTIRPLTIHARSILLQGLLPCPLVSLWERANVDNPAPIIDWLNEMKSFAGREDIASLCISYANSQNWIDGIVLGMESIAQLHLNLKAMDHDVLTPKQMKAIAKSRPLLSEKTLNPAFWNR